MRAGHFRAEGNHGGRVGPTRHFVVHCGQISPITKWNGTLEYFTKGGFHTDRVFLLTRKHLRVWLYTVTLYFFTFYFYSCLNQKTLFVFGALEMQKLYLKYEGHFTKDREFRFYLLSFCKIVLSKLSKSEGNLAQLCESNLS